jgi:hypothetical protein
MRRLEAKHWAIIAGFVTSTATVIAGLDHWGDLFTPAVVAGLLMQFATLLGALFAGAPRNPRLSHRDHPGRRKQDPLTDVARRSLL